MLVGRVRERKKGRSREGLMAWMKARMREMRQWRKGNREKADDVDVV